MTDFQAWIDAEFRRELQKGIDEWERAVIGDLDASPGPSGLLNVTKYSAYIPIPDDLADEARPPAPKPSRRTRFRWWRSNARERLAGRVYRFVAGHDLQTRDDW